MNPLSVFDPWKAQHRRTAWLPVIGVADTRSHFGGAPWLSASERWPACPVCGELLQLILQLELGELPPELAAQHGPGLLQIFYCTRTPSCELDAEGWSAFSRCHLLRVVPGTGPGAEPQPQLDSYPRQPIRAWQPQDDFPDPESHPGLGLTYTYDFQAHTVKIECPSLGATVSGSMEQGVSAERLSSALEGDKVGGWPVWVQHEELPSCPRCERPMEYLLQIDSEKNVPSMWGDMGVATVTRCRTHPEILALGWACG